MDNISFQTIPYRSTRSKRVLARMVRPAFWLFNRSAFRPFNEFLYDIALRLNGFAIGFPGQSGLTYPEEEFLKGFLPKIRDGVLMDVGANRGSYSKFLSHARSDLRILAFEPHPKTFGALQAAVGNTSVETFNLALSDISGSIKLYDFASRDGSTQASLSIDAVHLFEGDTVEYEVECETIDGFCASRSIDRIAFLKIDTEGFDLNVLRGAKNMLAEGKIDAIQFEFIPACIATRVAMRDFFEVLSGFSLHRLCVNGGLLPLPQYDVKRCEIYVVHNIIAFRNDFP